MPPSTDVPEKVGPWFGVSHPGDPYLDRDPNGMTRRCRSEEWTTAYRHLRDRNALLFAVAQEAADLLADAFALAMDSAPRSFTDESVTRARLYAGCVAYLDFASRDRAVSSHLHQRRAGRRAHLAVGASSWQRVSRRLQHTDFRSPRCGDGNKRHGVEPVGPADGLGGVPRPRDVAHRVCVPIPPRRGLRRGAGAYTADDHRSRTARNPALLAA
jgi:hypothetical protein